MFGLINFGSKIILQLALNFKIAGSCVKWKWRRQFRLRTKLNLMYKDGFNFFQGEQSPCLVSGVPRSCVMQCLTISPWPLPPSCLPITPLLSPSQYPAVTTPGTLQLTWTTSPQHYPWPRILHDIHHMVNWIFIEKVRYFQLFYLNLRLSVLTLEIKIISMTSLKGIQ